MCGQLAVYSKAIPGSAVETVPAFEQVQLSKFIIISFVANSLNMRF